LIVNFWIKAVTMATFRAMKSRYFPHFDQDSLVFSLSFGEIFLYFATSWKWRCLTFWRGKKSGLFRRFFQYSVICHYSKYMKLALADFNKNRVFNRICMWLQLSQIWKRFTEGIARKLAFIFSRDVTKIRKTSVVSRAGFHLGTRSCETMYRMQESKSTKLEPFYRLFIEFFVILSLNLGLNTYLNGVWNYCYLHQSDLTYFKRRGDFLSP